MTEVAEGTIVRVITRLDETCREVRDAARVIGDADLFDKMEVCQQLIRRDIVFAVSDEMYLPFTDNLSKEERGAHSIVSSRQASLYF